MSLVVTTGTIQSLNTPSSPTGANMKMYQNKYQNNPSQSNVDYYSHWGKVSVTEHGGQQGSSTSVSKTWDTNTGANLDADTDYLWRAHAIRNSTQTNGTTKTIRTAAMVAVNSGNPSASSVTSSTATISGAYIPRTVDSSVSVQIQYKKTTDVDWTNAGAAYATGGYDAVNMSRNITGLEGSTQYQMRWVLTRTTYNDGTLTSSTTSFTTEPAAPTVTTVAAAGVAATTAVLNATVDPNTISTDVTFEWDTDTGAPYANETTPAENFTGDGDQSVSKGITGLTFSTQYFFRAKAVHAGGTVYGTELNFTTAGNPSAEAADEDHMQIFEFNERKYGVASTINFATASPAATSSDRFFNAATPFVAGDVTVSKDGGGFANVTDLPPRIGSTPNFALTLTATEMQATTIVVMIVDQDGPAFRDAMLIIRTKQELGQLAVDATQLGSSASAVSLTPATGGYGIAGTGSPDFNGSIRSSTATAGAASTITLDASASATNDYYNGCIIVTTGGTGPNQQRVIVDYDGTSKVATVHKAWSVNPANDTTFLIVPGNDLWEVSPLVELAAVPGATSGFGKILQFVFQRFAYKRIQTATLHSMKKADSSTDFATAAVADDGTTQSFNKLA